jgi:hypothetical protein
MNKVCPMCGGAELYGKAGGILANGWQLAMKATRIAWFGSQGPIRLDGAAVAMWPCRFQRMRWTDCQPSLSVADGRASRRG